MDWHDPGNPVRNGLSIADEILGAPAGSIISIQGGNAYSTAIAYAEANRPDAGLRFEIIPLENDKKQLKK